MNFAEFVKINGVCKTAAGHNIHDLRVIDWDTNHPLIGFVEWKTGHLSELQWDKNGFPKEPSSNHGLHLIALKPRIVYDTIDISKIR